MAVVFGLNYMAVGIAGAFLFTPEVKSDASLNLNEANRIHCAAVFFYIAQLVASFLICFSHVADTVEGMLYTRFPQLEAWKLRKGWRVAAVAAAALLAILIPSFGSFIALLGGVGCTLAIYVLPHVAFLRCCKGASGFSTPGARRVSIAILIFGSLTGALTTAFACQQI